MNYYDIILTLFGREEKREELITNGATIRFDKESHSPQRVGPLEQSSVVNLQRC